MNATENQAPNNNRERPTFVHSTFWKVMGVMIAATSLYGTFSLATMLVDRNPPIVFHERYAMNNDVPQGGILSVSLIEEHIRYCKSDDYRWVIDSEQTKHTITSFSVSKASPYAVGKFHEQRDVTIPLAAALGPARYYIEAYYYCNILQRILDWPIIVRSPDVRFNVIPYKEPHTMNQVRQSIDSADIRNIQELRTLIPMLRFWSRSSYRADNVIR